MKQFTDSKGDTWDIEVNGGTVKRVSDLLEIDLGQPLSGDPPLITRFDTDIVFKVNLLCAVCHTQIVGRNVGEVEFAERLSGKALQSASDVFWQELALFFLSLGRKEVVGVMRKQREIVSDAIRRATEAIESGALEEAVSKELAALGDSAASTPQSPESTLEGTHSAS